MKTKLMLLISATTLAAVAVQADQAVTTDNSGNVIPAQKAGDRDANPSQLNNNYNNANVNVSQPPAVVTAPDSAKVADRDANATQADQTATTRDRYTDRDTMSRDQMANGAGMHQLGDLKKANQIIGMEVRGNDNERLGKVKDLALDMQNGRIVEVIVAKGGILGVDEKYVAVPPKAFSCDASTKSLRLMVDKDQFKNSPEFQWSHWKDSMNEDSVKEVYQRYGVHTYYGADADTSAGTTNFASGTTNASAAQVPATSAASSANGQDQRGQALRYYSYTGTNGSSSNYYYSTMTAPQAMGPVTRASKVIGSTAYNNQNEKLGKVHNVIVDLPAGRVVEVVLASGGFLGMHDELSAVPPQAFKWNSTSDQLTLDATRESLKSSPHFTANDWNNVNDPNRITEVYTTYHVQPYFTTAGVDNTAQNVRDRSGTTVTPLNQGNSATDRDTTAKIRRAIVADPNMSVNGKNVKIITRDGQVTLRGVVNSDGERTMISQEAASVAGADRVDNQIEVKGDAATPASSKTSADDSNNK